MKKRLFLTSLVAIASTGVANAATDVTFAGDYLLGDGLTTANVGTALNGSSYKYDYDKSNGESVSVAQDVDPDLSYFTYTDKDDAPADLTSGTNLTASDFYGVSAADNINVISHQTIAAEEEISRSNYEYINGKGETVTLGDAAQTFTETIALNPEYATVASVDVIGGSTVPVLTGDMYSWIDPDNNAVYHLNATHDGLVDANNMVVTPDAGTPQETALNAMIAAFNTDSAAISSAQGIVDGYADAEATAFAGADSVYSADDAKINTLTANYGTYTDALSLLSTATAAQSARQAEYQADLDLQTFASDLYNSSIETTLADAQAITLQDAKDYADSLANNYDAAGSADAEASRAQGEEAAIRGEFAAADTALQNNIDAETTRAQGEETAIRREFAAADTTLQNNINAEATARQAADETLQANIDTEALARANADTNLQNNIDNEVARATAQEAAIRGEFAAADAATLARANAYTDKKVDALEKNVSGGVAAATALSSVEVSNVKKGEVSVGGGYGYYNSQSAMAFGAAMGLSDNWSINAGAGIASGDKTQVAFRAGTNYKFKLF